MTEAAGANRIQGMACLYRGALGNARTHLREALRLYDPERDRDAKFRFGADTGAAAASYLAQTKWYLGEIDQAIELIEESGRRALESGHAPTPALIYHLRGMFDMHRGGAMDALRVSEALLELTQEHPMALYRSHGSVHASWARARLGDSEAGVTELARAIAAYADLGANLYLPFYQGLLAELEGEGQSARRGLTRIDEALALTQRTEAHWIDSFLHSVRGGILLKLDPTNAAPAEQAYLTAIGTAQQQKAKSFELLAALSLAKLHQSTNRPLEGHDVLAPALEGFAPTPEFPEIAEAQTLLAPLAETEEVKSAATARQQRLKLQTSYGQAMLHARGCSAPETKAAFARARELTAGIEDPSERFSVLYGRWANGFVSGQLVPTREVTDIMLREVAERPGSPEACTAARLNGNTNWLAGNFAAGRAELERALAMFDPERDASLVVRFAQDIGAAIMSYLALVSWPLGDVARAHRFIDQALARANEVGHVGTLAYVHSHGAVFEMMRWNPSGLARHTEALLDTSRAHQLPMFAAYGAVYQAWAHLQSTGGDAGLAELRAAIEVCRERGIGLNMPIVATALAEAEAQAGELDAALATIDDAVAETERYGQRWFEAETHRIRGKILSKRDPANTTAAEEAFVAAITIAQQQKAKSFELRASLSLTKLYQTTNRAVDAHAVLAPALDGFSPTPEFPDIVEARALLAALAW
jgi:predicted ATPase